MSKTTHTPGPWRWEFNAKHKSVQLVGGVPTFDLTIIDFERWGMSGATPRFRDTSEDGMNTMYRLCDKPEWIVPEPGRSHHKTWHQLVKHPDAQLIAAAPELLDALKDCLAFLERDMPVASSGPERRKASAAIAKATGAAQ